MQGFVSGRRCGDFVHILHAERGLDDHFKADFCFEAFGRFDLRHQHVDGVNIRRRARFRDHDQIQLVAGLFDDIDDVAIAIVRIQAVDPHRYGLRRPIQVVQRFDDVLARLFLVVGCNRIFEVKKYHVGGTFGGLLQEFRARARDRQFRAIEACWCRIDDGEAQGRSPQKCTCKRSHKNV